MWEWRWGGRALCGLRVAKEAAARLGVVGMWLDVRRKEMGKMGHCLRFAQPGGVLRD